MIGCIIVVIFILGFCFGALWDLKQRDKDNEEWFFLAQKVNNDWAEYCETLIEEIKMLRGVDK